MKRGFAGILVIVFMFTGCGEDENPIQPESENAESFLPVEVLVKKSGGIVQHPDGAVVQVSANTFSSDTTIMLAKIKDSTGLPIPENSEPITAVFELKSDPEVDYFAHGVEISLPIEQDSIMDYDSAYMAYWSGKQWIRIASYFDKQKGTLTGVCNHFSEFRGFSGEDNTTETEIENIGIPYYFQTGYGYCAYTSAAMLLKAYGIDKENYEISTEFGDGENFDNGITNDEIDEFAGYISGQIDSAVEYSEWYRTAIITYTPHL